MAKVLKFKQPNVARQSGELARIRVIKGPDTGTTYILTASRGTIGRGEDNDIILSDLRTSRHHAEIILSGDSWMVRDAGSQNGIICNGIATRSASLNGKDVVSLGETTFEFIASTGSRTGSIVAPNFSPLSLNGGTPLGNQRQLGATELKITHLGSPPRSPSSNTANGGKSGILAIGAVILVLIFALGGEDKKDGKKPVREPASRLANPDSKLPPVPQSGPRASQALRSADQFFRIGLREFKSGNFSRAKMQFETALQVFPGHLLALRYTTMCDQEIEDLVKRLLQNGRKNRELGRVKMARGQYEAVLRLLASRTTEPGYLQAKEELKLLEISRDIAGGGT